MKEGVSTIKYGEKMEIVKKANEMKLTILNRYRESKDATS